MNPASASGYQVELLSEHHNRSTFCTGVEALDRYLWQQAGQEPRRNIATPFVLVRRETGIIAGYYTLSNTAIHTGQLPAELARKLPKYPLVPATLVGRLAIDQSCRGEGLGQFLLLDALRRSREASRHTASFAVVVEALNESAVAFYRRHDFLPFADQPTKLFLPMKTIAQLFARQ
jgi:predicted GNAT family N-acyltransferase